MKFVFYSVADNFERFHRYNEIEALLNSSEEVEAIFFTDPKFLLQSVYRLFKKAQNPVSCHPQLKVHHLYVLMPKRWALKSKVLNFIFVALPIKLQTFYVKKRFFSKGESNDIINWFYKPDQYLYLKSFTPYIYLHYDNYKNDKNYAYSANKNFDNTLNCCIKNSLFTLMSSSKLFEAYKYVKPNSVYYYPNAISRQLIPSDIDKIMKPNASKVIGFIGQLDNTFDVELVKKISKKFKDYSIRLIGGYSKAILEDLAEYKNIELLGYMKYEFLGEEIKNFSIGICPYKNNSFNKFRNPLKITEYYSYGLPVVSISCDIDDKAKEFMGIAETHDEFVESIKNQLAENTSSKKIQRIKYAESNCWDNRIAFLINKILDNQT